MKKDELRAVLRQGRESLSLDEAASRSTKIIQAVLDIVDWPAVKSLHTYSSVDDWREADTEDLIRQLSKRWPHLRIVQPTLMRDNPLPHEDFDVIIVPVLGFDKDCNRLGLGGGWYDRFLATQPQAKKVGLAYQSAFIPHGLPYEAHDIPLDIIVTEEGVFKR